MLLLVVPVLLLVKPVLQLVVSVLLLVMPVLQLVKPVYVILSKIRRTTAQLTTTMVNLSVYLAVKSKTNQELLQRSHAVSVCCRACTADAYSVTMREKSVNVLF